MHSDEQSNRPATRLMPITPLDPRTSRAPSFSAHATTLIGRERDIGEIVTLLERDDVRLITLVGAGGIGKTRLALAIAGALEHRSSLASNIRLVDLTAITDAALVAPAIIAALGGHATTRDDPQTALLDLIGDRRMLLILDNCEQIRPALTIASRLLDACPGLKLLATSRVRLRLSAERLYPVQPLAITPDASDGAIALFAERAQAVAPGFTLTEANRPAVAAICRRLDGLPLAIELAAARTAVLPPAALLVRLERRLPMLTGGPRDRPERQRTMTNAIAWSDELLTSAEQVLFRRLAVFSGSFSLEAAESIAGSEAPLDLLTALVESSLVMRETMGDDSPRFQLLQTIREYALDRLAAGGEGEEIRRRHAAFYRELAIREEWDGWEPGQAERIARIAAEQEQLRAALAWELEAGDPLAALRLATALGWYWLSRGLEREGRRWIERSLDNAPDAPAALRARAQSRAGAMALFLGDYPAAHAHFEAVLTDRDAADHSPDVVRSVFYTGAIAEYRGDDRTATRWYERALALARRAGDRRMIGHLLGNLADVAYRAGDHQTARRLDEESLTELRAVDDLVGVVLALNGVAQAQAALGERAVAIALLHEAIVLADRIGYPPGIADSLAGIAAISVEAGDAETAARLLGAVAAIQDEVALPLLQHHARHQRALEAVAGTLSPEAYAGAFATGRSAARAEIVGLALTCQPPEPRARTPLLSAAALAAGLTVREVEVLRLLAERRTDAEMAETLSISPATIATHVARIREKLGVHSRRAAVDAARRKGIV